MINLFGKLEKEKLLKEKGVLLDLGCGNGRLSEPFFKAGYETTLVDENNEILQRAQNNLKKIGVAEVQALNMAIEDFKFENFYDGIILSNVLPFTPQKKQPVF